MMKRFSRFKKPSRYHITCCYCGEDSDIEFDHVENIRFSNRKRRYDAWHIRTYTVGCCHECNMLLTDHFLPTIKERADHLSYVVEQKYRNLLENPLWSEEELAELDEKLRRVVLNNSVKRLSVINRLRHLAVVSKIDISICDYWKAMDMGKAVYEIDPATNYSEKVS